MASEQLNNSNKTIRSSSWSIQDSQELYNVKYWGQGYFDINSAGHLTLHPSKDPARAVDLKDLLDKLILRDIHPPLLIRVSDVLRHRLKEIQEAFSKAIGENDYKGKYSLVYPIKVNQGRHVVEEIIQFGHPYNFGLEAGSKPELLAILAETQDLETPIICNGFKDESYIEMVMLARKMGKFIIPVVEKFSELHLILKLSKKLGVSPMIGVRAKLSAKGAGRWKYSAGDRSKFGLTFFEILELVKTLEQENMLSCLKLLHFHIGSQIPNIRNIKEAIREATRVYAELHRLGTGIEFLDVGGGLGVDYDGSQSNFESSVNYSLQEYANDIIYAVGNICSEVDIPHPHIISESGRAVVAYHSILIFNVLGVSSIRKLEVPKQIDDDVPQPIKDLLQSYYNLSKKNAIESYHDVLQAKEEAQNLFNLGYLNLEYRALTDNLYWNFCEKLRDLYKDEDYIPEEFEGLDVQLASTYFCNYSLFQSMPDSWAVKQLFPIMPIHRLNEEPTARATLADITCDSDGKVDQFIDLHDIKRVLELHPLKEGDNYYLGVFLVGAYQEILGDLHNLFGDTNVVHISMEEETGEVLIENVVKGDDVRDVLRYVQFNPDELLSQMRAQAERAVRKNKISIEESTMLLKFYESTLNGYTYLKGSHS
ncbi:MAG: biosynthetic arginine decarboxylase [Planctomycetota bacterium]